MVRKRPSKIIVALLTLIISLTAITGVVSQPKIQVVAGTEEAKEESVFDDILDFVAKKGAGVVKSKLPKVGDFLCAKVFDQFDIDYTDSYTKALKSINSKLDSMQKELSQLMENQKNEKSQNVIRAIFNQTKVFSMGIRTAYNYYNNILQSEKKGTISAESAKIEEKNLYDKYITKMIFGSTASTGDIDLQLDMLFSSIVLPDVTDNRYTLLEHYHKTYEYLWAFDMQSYAPKKEFLGYLSALLLQGIELSTFKHTYDLANATTELEKLAIEDSWETFKNASDKATKYLSDEITAVENAEKASDTSNTTLHYATGKKISKKLYLAKMANKSTGNSDIYNGNNHFTYGVRDIHKKWHTMYTLNNRSFMNTVQSEYAKYVANYKKPSTFTLANYLKEIGFDCDDWNFKGMYRGQSHNIKVQIFTVFTRFYLEYTTIGGKSDSLCWTRWKDDECWISGDSVLNYAAFVDDKGTLVGSYEKSYRRICSSGEPGAYVYKGLKSHKSYTDNVTALGKVW